MVTAEIHLKLTGSERRGFDLLKNCLFRGNLGQMLTIKQEFGKVSGFQTFILFPIVSHCHQGHHFPTTFVIIEKHKA